MNRHRNAHLGRAAFALGFVLIFLCASSVPAQQTTSFTYQGRLTDGGAPANGNYDLQFTLWDAASGGTQQPQPAPITVTRNNVSVSGGIFTVQLDFTVSAFPGADRFLEISVKPAGGPTFTMLSPRQQISSTPYAIRTLSAQTADTATNATQLGGVTASQYVQTNDSRLSDARPPTAGASNYIQNNPASTQSGSFNITGDGTAAGTLTGNVVNATTQYNLGGQRVLIGNSGNLFAGALAGAVNTSGTSNVFVGPSAGRSNTIGSSNSFFGSNAGFSNVGDNAGNGNGNSFFGSRAGNNNTGSLNSFFGVGAGLLAAGNENSFFGANAGSSSSGSFASFFGSSAGNSNAGVRNSFFGYQAGLYHTTGDFNNFFGARAGFGDSNNGSTGSANNFFGDEAGASFTSGNSNSLYGDGAGNNLLTGSRNTFIGAQAGNTVNAPISDSTAIGYNATVGCSHCMVLGDANDNNLKVGIGTSILAPGAKLDVEGGGLIAVDATSSGFAAVFGQNNGNGYAGYFQGKALVTDHLKVGTPNGQVMMTVASIPPLPSGAAVCFNFNGDLLQCGASSLRFKKNVQPFGSGLNVIRRLRPISFDWKDGSGRDIGLGAEDVAKVAPSFTFTDKNGEVAGVKYERLNILLINAIKEQQQQIEQLKKHIRQLRSGKYHRSRRR